MKTLKLLTIAVIASTVLLSSSVESAMFTIDADSYADGANMSAPGWGVTLSSPSSGAFTTDGYVYARTAADSSRASTGTNVFGNSLAGNDIHGNPLDEIWYEDWSNEWRLRADFSHAANYVAIDIIGNNDFADYGILEAYDSGGDLLASVSNGSALYDGDVFTAAITRASYDIAYVIASGIGGDTVHLDNLEANVIPEPAENVVVNGDFSDGLTGWEFTSITEPGSCGGWSVASVVDGEGRIHAHYDGDGILRQELSTMLPDRLSFSWNLDGDCSSVRVFLCQGENWILEFVTRHDASAQGNTNSWVAVAGTRYEVESSPNYLDNGSCEVTFDYESLEARFTIESDRGVDTCVLAIPMGFSVDAVELLVGNSCCDGRNDAYGYFDNVVLEGAAEPEGPCMVLIPGGEFEMGDHFNEGQADELPVHSVYVDSFYMGCYEISNSEYCNFLNLADVKVVSGLVYASSDNSNSYPYCDTHSVDADSQIDFSDPDFSVRTKGSRDMSDDPMVQVSWYGAVAYCNWRSSEEGYEACYNLSTWECDFSKNGYRLPAEAEWEYAARGGLSGKRFPWADPNITHSQANYYSSSSYSYDTSPTRGYHPGWSDGMRPYTSPVGSFSPNGYGLYDMSGNVWGWCNDWYGSDYYDTSPYDNPTGPPSGTYRVLRGGGFDSDGNYCRAANRHYYRLIHRDASLGFRIVSAAEPEIIYVDADAVGNNDGSSWEDAYNYVQDALKYARSDANVSEIWVAEGIYKPDENTDYPGGTGDRAGTFELINGVTVKGGYAGFGEPDPDTRDVDMYETILTGDLAGDDGPDFANNVENSYHVVMGGGTDANAVLDGFTITAGNANGSEPNNYGGGMYNVSGNPTVTNCTFWGNSAYGGGGMFSRFAASSPTVTNCAFTSNSGTLGGGVYNALSSPTVTNCTFNGNLAANRGGGMYNGEASPTVMNCSFNGNSATNHGGGMCNYVNSSPTVTNCTFSDNEASDSGGGMYNIDNSSPAVSNCTFSGNSVNNYGGGIYNHAGCSPIVINCIFRHNSASNYGGGMLNWDNSEPNVTNCTFTGNSATNYGGGMANGNSSPMVTNCIFWADTAPTGAEIYDYGTSSTTVSYSDLQGGWPGGNINEDPLFVDVAGGDYHLSSDSPCIDAGANAAVPPGITTDFDGNPRIMNGVVDMGAYEFKPCWFEEAKLVASDGGEYEWFGISVDVDGDYVIVGADSHGTGGAKPGAAYIYERNGGSWVAHQKLQAAEGPTASDHFGISVGISGEYAIVGACRYLQDVSGSAYIFELDSNSESWVCTSTLIAPDGHAGDFFGQEVSVSGNFAIAGAYRHNTHRGSAYIFKRNDEMEGGNWELDTKLTAADGQSYDEFGRSVSISGDYVAVGVPGDAYNSGSVCIYKYDGENWVLQDRLVAWDGSAGENFGNPVSIASGYCFVGVGADDEKGTDTGSVYVFKREGESWVKQGKLTASDAQAGDRFSGVSVSGDYAVVSAWKDDDKGENSGSAYVFELTDGNWTEIAKLTAYDGASDDRFGYAASVSICEKYAVVGAPLDDDNGTNSGSAYVFENVCITEPILPDLDITSEDLDFVPLPGEPCTPVTISATVWNFGWTAAENVLVTFKDFDETIGNVVIPSILPGDSETVSIERTGWEASFRLITVTADPCNTVIELEENNNSGSKVYQVGDVPEMDASIEITCSAPTGFPPGSTATISGQAIYNILIEGQPNYEYPVKGGSVNVEVFDCNGVQQQIIELYTDTDGRFDNVSFEVPCHLGDQFEVVITVTDGSLTGTLRRSFDVIEWRDIYVYPSDITFSNSNPADGETITVGATIHADVHNTYTEYSVPVTFFVHPPGGSWGQIGQTTTIAEMAPGGSDTVSVTWTNTGEGYYYIAVELAPNFSDDKNSNNRAVRRITVGPPPSTPPPPPPPPPPPTEPVRFDLYVHSEDIGFSDMNPDLGESIDIGALIHAQSDNTRAEPNVPVTFYAHHGTGETYQIGRTQYTGEIQRGRDWSITTTWRNAAEGPYIIEVEIGPGFSDDNNLNNQATRELTVGNRPPDADAGPNQPVECACNTELGTQVTLDGTGSSDPDGDPLTYTWTGPFHESPASGSTPTVTLADGCPGEYLITLVVKDGEVNSLPDDVLITVQDTIPPEVNCPADLVIECGQSTDPCETGQAMATDDCDESPMITFNDLSGGACPRLITRTWTATDASGNSNSCQQVITVVDTTPPVINCPPDTTVECDGGGNTTELNVWLASATASDICGSVTLSNDFSGLSDDCGETGSAIVTWTAVDECGNPNSCSATFTIVDTTPPTIITPANDLTVECDGSGNTTELSAWLSSNGGAVATDTCSGVTWSNDFTGLSDDCGATGSATVTFTATDDCGLSSTTTATFTIEDTTLPTFTITPQDVNVYRDGNGNIADLEAWLSQTVVAEDMCGDVNITNDFASGPNECGNTGSITVTWRATDECDNNAPAQATFTIIDPTAGVTYNGDLLISTGGEPNIGVNLVATLWDDNNSVPAIDGEQVTFTLTADGVGTFVETTGTIDGVATVITTLEPAIYTVNVSLGCSDFTAAAILVVYNPDGGFASGAGQIIPPDDGENTHPNVRARFGFEARYREDDPTGNIKFRYFDRYMELESDSIEQLVITGANIVQFKGWATVNGVAGNWFFVKGIDNGDPGRNNDTFEIKVWHPGVSEEGDPSERAAGVLQAGNIVVQAR